MASVSTKVEKKKIFITDDDFFPESKCESKNEKNEKVKGLFYFKDFKDIIESKDDLISFLDQRPWKSLSDSKNSRKVQHYGYLYDYKSGKTTTKTDPIPEEFQSLIDSLKKKCMMNGLKASDFNQVIVNNYEASQGISAHTDVKEYGPIIGCYTIGSGATMRFTKGDEKYDLYVEPNSLYIMSGESRYEWKHEMVSRKSDVVDGVKIARGRRVSITFRCVPN
jgi:alkylated DNA repair dioxygenase AlkB